MAQRLKRNGIDLYTDFQRKANLWDEGRKSRLIESILLRFPLPNFYFDVEDENKWLVVDVWASICCNYGIMYPA